MPGAFSQCPKQWGGPQVVARSPLVLHTHADTTHPETPEALALALSLAGSLGRAWFIISISWAHSRSCIVLVHSSLVRVLVRSLSRALVREECVVISAVGNHEPAHHHWRLRTLLLVVVAAAVGGCGAR